MQPIYSKYIHRRPPPFIARARTRMGYLLRDKYARRPHECNAAAVRSTHERARARARTHAHARRAFIKRRTYGARVRATRRLLGGTFPRRRHPSCPGSRNPSLPPRAYALPSPAGVRIPSRDERRVYFHRFAKTGNKSFHSPIIFASRGFIVCVSIHLDSRTPFLCRDHYRCGME